MAPPVRLSRATTSPKRLCSIVGLLAFAVNRETLADRNHVGSLRAQCRSYGFSDNSPAMAQCVMQFYLQQKNARAAEQPRECRPDGYSCTSSGGVMSCAPYYQGNSLCDPRIREQMQQLQRFFDGR